MIQPLPAGDATPVKVESVQVECEDGKPVVGMVCGDDLFLLSYDGPARMTCRNVSFEGSALLLRYDPRGPVVHAHIVDGRALSVGGRTLFCVDDPTPARSLALSGTP